MNKKNQKGFTLVELIVVIAIVAILAPVAIVGYTQFIKNARESKAQAELDQIYNVMYADAVLSIEINASGVARKETDQTFTAVVILEVKEGKILIKANPGTPADGERSYDAASALEDYYNINASGEFKGILTLDTSESKLIYTLPDATAERSVSITTL